MKEDVDKLAQLFEDGKNASDKLCQFFETLVPHRMFNHGVPQIQIGRHGMPYTDYPKKEPEAPSTEKMLQTTKTFADSWTRDVNALLDTIGKTRYKMQFNDPQAFGRMLMHGELTDNEAKWLDILTHFSSQVAELRKIIIDYETTSEKAVASTANIEPATYDPKTRTIFFADEAIRFNKNAEYSPAICKLMFEKPEKLWELKDFLTLWDSLYDYLPDLQKPTDWNKIYDAIKKMNSRVAKTADISDLFKLNTKSVRLNPKYITPSKK